MGTKLSSIFADFSDGLRKNRKFGQTTVLIAFGFYFAILLFGIKNPRAIYNDGGFNYTQLYQFIASGYSDFSYHYGAADLDPEKRLLPYQRPWLADYNGKTFLQYPPWFMFTGLPAYLAFKERGFLLFNFVFLIGIFITFYKLTRREEHPTGRLFWSLAFFVFGSTLTFYTYHYHEYTLTWFLAGLSYFFALRAVTGDYSYKNVFLYGLFAGLATVFRLELMIALFPIGAHLVFFQKRLRIKEGVAALVGFFLPLSVFLIGNQILHGHPLSLRYVINVADKGAKTLADRLVPISEILFDPEIGIFIQSPWVILVPLIGFLYRSDAKIRVSALWFTLSSLAVLAALPNSGSHFAPRYLFGTLMAAAFVISRPLSGLFSDFKVWKKPGDLVLVAVLLPFFFLSAGKYKREWKIHLASQKNIQAANDALASIPDENLLVFREFSSGQNTQFVLVHKRVVVAENKKKVSYLLKQIRNHPTPENRNFTVAYPFMGKIDPHSPETDSPEKRRAFLQKIPGLHAEEFPMEPVKIEIRQPYLLLFYHMDSGI